MTLRLSKEQYAALQKHMPARASKYGNRKKLVGGRLFDSTKEAKRYEELLLLQNAGEIADLMCQRPVACIVNGMHVCDWIADFVYWCRVRKALIHEDSKSPATQKNAVYRLKKKLVLASTGIEITET